MKATTILVMLFILALSYAGNAQNWQGSRSNDDIKLDIRDKDGKSTYIVDFVVRDEKENKKYEVSISVYGNKFGEVKFPRDFDTHLYNTDERRFYKWYCEVKGKKILYGSFYYPNFELDFAK